MWLPWLDLTVITTLLQGHLYTCSKMLRLTPEPPHFQKLQGTTWRSQAKPGTDTQVNLSTFSPPWEQSTAQQQTINIYAKL